MSTRCISWGKERPVGKADLTTILCRFHEIWEPYLPGTLWVTRACNGTALPLLFYIMRQSMHQVPQYFDIPKIYT